MLNIQTRIRPALAALLLTLTGVSATAQTPTPAWSADAPLTEAQARTLLNRLGYGATPASLRETTGTTARDYVWRAVKNGSNLPAPVQARIDATPVSQSLEDLWEQHGPGSETRRKLDEQARKEQQREMSRYLAATVQARLLTMANSDNPGHEALLSFWLNHFSIFGSKGPVRLLAWDYLRALDRAMAADSFEALLRASFRHPAMQIYLDNVQSVAPNSRAALQAANKGRTLGLNENLARELLELHTLGVDGGYSQADVQALARVISGAGIYNASMHARELWRAGAQREGLFLFDPRRHDFGVKVLLGENFPAGVGAAEIDRALHLLAMHPATARHLSYKLAQRFWMDEPPPDVVDAMSATYLQTGGRISATLLTLVSDPRFGASLLQPVKYKEPLDYMLSVARATCADQPITHGLLLASTAQVLGQAPLGRSTPDGYGARESDWLSPVGMAKRLRLAAAISAQRYPLASPPASDFQEQAEQGQDMARGQSCTPSEATLSALIGPLSDSTLEAGRKLDPRERMALWLASPEFMRR